MFLGVEQERRNLEIQGQRGPEVQNHWLETSLVSVSEGFQKQGNLEMQGQRGQEIQNHYFEKGSAGFSERARNKEI